jgi:hypothetical protein
MTVLVDKKAERGGPGPKGRQPKRAMPASGARGLTHEPPHPPFPLQRIPRAGYVVSLLNY